MQGHQSNARRDANAFLGIVEKRFNFLEQFFWEKMHLGTVIYCRVGRCWMKSGDFNESYLFPVV